MRGGRIAGYLRLPEHTTEIVFEERAILQLARRFDWPWVRMFRDRHDTRHQWQSLVQATQRGEIVGIVMVTLESIPSEEWRPFIELVLRRNVRLVTLTEELDSWSMDGRLWLSRQLFDE